MRMPTSYRGDLQRGPLASINEVGCACECGVNEPAQGRIINYTIRNYFYSQKGIFLNSSSLKT